MACISVAERGVMAARRMRHVNIRRHWIHEAVRDGVLKIEHCDSEDMLADEAASRTVVLQIQITDYGVLDDQSQTPFADGSNS
jgi:hypothetical protein